MAFSSGPQPFPTVSTAEIPPNDGSLDMPRPKVRAALCRTMEPDAQISRLLPRILRIFMLSLAAFIFSLWNSFLISLACAISGFLDALFQLRSLPSAQHKDAGSISIINQPHGMKCTPPQDYKEVEESTAVPAPVPVQPESGANEVIEISDSENEKEEQVIEIGDSDDEDEMETSSVGQSSGNLNNQGSGEEGWDESVQAAEGVQEQQNSLPANNSSIGNGLDAQSPISIIDEDESDLSGVTLVEPGSSGDIPYPEFADECPRLRRKSDAPPAQPRPELPEYLERIDRGSTFEDDFGWIIETAKKDYRNALREKIVQDFTKCENSAGIIYILRHSRYENLYKVGCTMKSMKARRAGFPPCIREMTEEVHTTKRMWGFRRVEALAHRNMASRNVHMTLCMACFNQKAKGADDGKNKNKKSPKGKKNDDEDEQQSTSHKEWFKGDLEDIKRCVEYWVEVVRASYVDGEFIGNVSEITNRGLSSQTQRLESVEDSARLREKLNESPSRLPQSADAAEQLDAGAHAARKEEEGAGEDGCGEGELEVEESGKPDEVSSAHGGVIWKRRDTSDDRPFRTPEKRAVRRSPRLRKSGGAEGVARPVGGLRPGTEVEHAV